VYDPAPFDTTRSCKGLSWDPWEDKKLAMEVSELDPYTAEGIPGKVDERWQVIAATQESHGIRDRSLISCRDRMTYLIERHLRNNAESKKKTGVNEDFTEFEECLEIIIQLRESISRDSEQKRSARDKMAKKKSTGAQLRAASQAAQVAKRELLSQAEGETCSGTTESNNDFAEHRHKKTKKIRSTMTELLHNNRLQKVLRNKSRNSIDYGRKTKSKRK
jgi:hypothetical protein